MLQFDRLDTVLHKNLVLPFYCYNIHPAKGKTAASKIWNHLPATRESSETGHCLPQNKDLLVLV